MSRRWKHMMWFQYRGSYDDKSSYLLTFLIIDGAFILELPINVDSITPIRMRFILKREKNTKNIWFKNHDKKLFSLWLKSTIITPASTPNEFAVTAPSSITATCTHTCISCPQNRSSMCIWCMFPVSTGPTFNTQRNAADWIYLQSISNQRLQQSKNVWLHFDVCFYFICLIHTKPQISHSPFLR